MLLLRRAALNRSALLPDDCRGKLLSNILCATDFYKGMRRGRLGKHSLRKTLKALPDGFFDHFSNVRVLDLLGCVVSPIGHSSFLRLCNLRMLRLEQCKVNPLDHPNSHSSAPEDNENQYFLITYGS
uniref:Uncharacterized protein n=1 Tax=Ananas comosus var. bracteatus TaxID=296719 RepID=A0A6V7NI81_ANACO|nr:unnamed protein product [Ananas comosus var. bracteatus]